MPTAYLREVDQNQELLCKGEVNGSAKTRALLRIQQALIAAQEIGDEKLQIVQIVQDLIENKTKQLDMDFRNLGKIANYHSSFLYLIFMLSTKIKQNLSLIKNMNRQNYD